MLGKPFLAHAERDEELLEQNLAERAHQGIGKVTMENVEVGVGEIECRERLGGILKHYIRAA